MILNFKFFLRDRRLGFVNVNFLITLTTLTHDFPFRLQNEIQFFFKWAIPGHFSLVNFSFSVLLIIVPICMEGIVSQLPPHFKAFKPWDGPGQKSSRCYRLLYAKLSTLRSHCYKLHKDGFTWLYLFRSSWLPFYGEGGLYLPMNDFQYRKMLPMAKFKRGSSGVLKCSEIIHTKYSFVDSKWKLKKFSKKLIKYSILCFFRAEKSYRKVFPRRWFWTF